MDFFIDLKDTMIKALDQLSIALEAPTFRTSLIIYELLTSTSSSTSSDNRDPIQDIDSIIASITFLDESEREKACLNFLSSLRKVNRKLAISMRKKWQCLARNHAGFPDNFLAAELETSISEEQFLSELEIPPPPEEPLQDNPPPHEHHKRSISPFADHHDQMAKILASCETETLEQFSEGLVQVGLLSTAERDQAYKIECPVIKSKAIVSVVAKVIERGVKPHKLLERLLSLLNKFRPELKFDAIIHDLQKKGYKIKSNSIKVQPEMKLTVVTPHSVPSGNEGCHKLNKYQKHLQLQYGKLVFPRIDRDEPLKFFPLSCKDAQGLAIELDCIPQLQADQDDPPRSLIIGAPGIGKSALVYELCKKWKECHLKKYEYVILLQASDFALNEIISLNDIVPEENKNWVRPIIANDGEGTLIIIDGYDELTDEQRNKRRSFVHRLIRCKTLSAAALIVTTRPWCGKDIQEFFPNRIEILGFTKESRDMFLSHYALDCAEEVVTQLETLSLEGCSFIPLYLSLMIQVKKEEHLQEKDNLKSRTKMYGALIMSIIVKFLRSHNQESLLPKPFKFTPGGFFDLPTDIYDGFLKLCSDSYKVAIYDKTPQPAENEYDIDGYGLLIQQEIVNGTMSESVHYRYLHPSIMEYLAAYAISRTKTPDFIRDFFVRFKKSTRHFSILEFLSGFGCVPDELFRIEEKYIHNFSVLQQLCETESVEVSRSAFEGLSRKSIISRTWPKPSFRDFWCLGRILATVDVKWEFGFTLRDLEDHHLKMLLQGIRSIQPSANGSIEKLRIGLNSFTSKGIEHLHEISNTTNFLSNTHYLDLRGNHLKSDAIQSLCKTLLLLRSLKKFLFHNNEIDSDHHAYLIKTLSHTSINHVSLSNLQEQECRQLLHDAKNLNVVELWQISTGSVKATISAIPESNLDELQFHQSKVDDTIKFPKQFKLTKLTFSNCGINSRCATIIASAVSTAIGFSSLDLQNNIIDDDGGKELLKLKEEVDLCDSYEHNRFTKETKELLKARKH